VSSSHSAQVSSSPHQVPAAPQSRFELQLWTQVRVVDSHFQPLAQSWSAPHWTQMWRAESQRG
jgi:hypothetical protein